MRRPKLNLSYANVMSTIGVFIALGGTSYAVARNSIGTTHLRRDAVTSAKIKDRSIRTEDIASSARLGPRGLRGPQGPPGPAGTAVATGTLGPAEPWAGLSLAAGWANFGSDYLGAGYRRDQLGRVHLRGLVTRTDGLPPAESPIGTLPATHAPPARMIFAANGGAADTRIDVLASGQVRWVNGTAAEKDYASLDGISFWPR